MSYLVKAATRNAVAVTHVRLAKFKIVVSAPQCSCRGVIDQLYVMDAAGSAVTMYGETRQLVAVKPSHCRVYGSLHAVIRIRQSHEQLHYRGAFRGTV